MACNLGEGAFYNDSGQNYKSSAIAEESILQRLTPPAPAFFPQLTAGKGLGAGSRRRRGDNGTAIAFLPYVNAVAKVAAEMKA
jgi:hypothetical protein